mgnify:FL=1
MSPYYQLDSLGTLKDMTFPVALTTSDKNQVLSDFWKMQNNRVFIIQYYLEVEKRIKALQAETDKELH